MLAQGQHSYNRRAEDIFQGRRTGKRGYKFCPPVSATFICPSLMFPCHCTWGICMPVFVIQYSLTSTMQMTTGMHQGPADSLGYTHWLSMLSGSPKIHPLYTENQMKSVQ